MRIKNFPRLPVDSPIEAKLQALYEWCYDLSLALKGVKKNVKASDDR